MKWLTDDEFFGTELVESGALSMGSAEAKTAAGIAQNTLSSLATSPDFLAKMQVAFGNSFDVEKAVKLASAWAQGDFSEFPEIEIRSEAEINGALGAFAAATGKIYLSREFLAKNAGNVTAVAGVLLEEFGHFVDSQINSVDAIGDEGEIFSDLVQGKALSQGELAGLKGEDDSAVVVLDGELRAIEQKIQSDSLNFFSGEVSWTDISNNNTPTPLFEKKFPEEPITTEFLGGKFEFQPANIKLDIFANWGNYGKTEFSYPVNVNVEIPNNLAPGEEYTLKGNTQVTSPSFNNIGNGTEAFKLPNAGLNFNVSLGQAQFTTEPNLKNPLTGEPLSLAGVKFSAYQAESKIDIVSILANQFDFQLFGGGAKITANPPEINSLKTEIVNNGQLPVITGTGRTEKNILNLGFDLDQLLFTERLPQYVALKALIKELNKTSPVDIELEGLKVVIKSPTGELKRVKDAEKNANKELEEVEKQLQAARERTLNGENELRTAQAKVQQIEAAFQAGQAVQAELDSSRRQAEFRIQKLDELRQQEKQVGDKLASEKLLQETYKQKVQDAQKNLENKPRVDFNAELNILDLTANIGLALEQEFKFEPDKVIGLDLSLDDESVKNGGSVTLKREEPNLDLDLEEGIEDEPTLDLDLEEVTKTTLGDFTIKAPSQGCGIMKLTAIYELSGTAKNNIDSVFQGDFIGKGLEASGSANLLGIGKGANLGQFSLGPFIPQVRIPSEGLASPPFTLIGSEPDPIPFLPSDSTIKSRQIIKTIKTSEFNGIEQDDENPSGNKNLKVEVEYEIPYNLPVSVSDASVTEGDSGTKDLVFPVTLRDTPKEAVTLSYSWPKGSGSVTIAAGQTSGEIKIPVTGDETVEQDETFTLTVKDQNGKLFADCKGTDSSEATGTIIDDDEGKPNPPKNGGKTFNDPRIVTIDKQYHDFQAAGEFTLIESTTGDLKIQVRQQPIGNNPRSNVSDNTAVATVLGGKRIGIYKDQGLLIDGQPTQIANDDALAIGEGRIYREGNTYTVVYPTGDQLVAKVGSRVNVEVYLTDDREGKVKGLLGNFNKNPKDDLAKRDGTVIPEPVSQQQLYGEYADSWRVNQAESLFDYKPAENTNTFTLQNYPRQKVKIEDLTPADVAKAEQLIGDRIKNPTTREAAIIDLVLTDFDPDILEEAINAPDPDSVLAIALPFTANSDFTTTTVNTATKIDILANDTTAKDPLSIKEFNTKSVAGGIITLDNNNTPNDKTDDKLTYTPPLDFTGTDKFNYLLTDGKQIQAATVNININSLKLDNLSGNNGFVLNGTEAGNFSGVAVSKTGDINGDKIDDIIVGSFGADPNNVNAAGKSQVIFGTQKFPASVNLSQLNGQNGFTLNGTDAEGFSGGTVSSAGDINGDGIKDFIIGAFGATVNGQNNAGKTYIVFGTNQGFPANFNLANLNGNNGFAVTGTNTFDYAGLFATGISDINGDRIDDILISAPGPLGGTPGKSYVIYGRTTGFSPNLNLTEINNNNGFVINGIDGNSSGTASSGDINGDGIPDLVIGADGGTTSGGINAGKTYVIFGQQGGFTGSINVPELNGTTGFVIAGLTAEERSGIALTATGDINGDGNKDIVIGAPAATVGDQINAGKTYVIYGKKEGFPVILNPAELNGSNGFTISGFDAEGSAGNAVSYAGDVNKDGFDDLLIGASSANSNDQNNAGKTFVIFGSKEFPANFSLAEANGKNALVLNGVETDGLLGTAVSGGGDINGDGIDDIIVGAPGSLFQDSPGKSYAVFGSRGFGFANPNNGLQGTVQDDIINGTQEDDTISGRQGNDKIFGNAGQDVLSGNLNDDYLDGEKGQDILIGGDGNDSLFGGLGNDVLKGDNGNDILTGVDINAINPGIEEIDTLTGGGGSDIFVLGDVNNTYYDNLDSDYALITDFNASDDSIQLHGKADDYLLVPFSQANQTGMAIYRKASAQNELISILQGGSNLSLSGNYFNFVGAG